MANIDQIHNAYGRAESYNVHSKELGKQIIIAEIIKVNNSSHLMDVLINDSGGYRVESGIPIYNQINEFGNGIRIMPVVNESQAILYQERGKYTHLGYDHQNMLALTDDKNVNKDSDIRLLRYLEQGEIQIRGVADNEIYLDRDGDILIRDRNDSRIEIESFTSTINLSSANFMYEGDGLRLRMGNVRRNIKDDTDEIDFIADIGEPQQQEFLVEVGVITDEDGLDEKYPQNLSVGMLGLGSKIYDPKGKAINSAGQPVQFVVKTTGGGGINIRQDGSVGINDYKGGSFTLFKGGRTGEKSLRSGDSRIVVRSYSIEMVHRDGFGIELTADGHFVATSRYGYGLIADDHGVTINASDAAITMSSPNISFLGEVTFGSTTTDSLMKNTITCTLFNAHVHAGPVGPPTVAWIPQNLAALGISVS